ncbi:MAG: beta-L-arabinofuranosidase domain-containing protein [Halanaerobiaceae bacterium]
MNKLNTISSCNPEIFKKIEGFLGKRFYLNMDNRLKNEKLITEYITPYQKKNHKQWFWIGEQIGKWLDAATYSALIADDRNLQKKIKEIITDLNKCQEKDGYLGVTRQMHRTPVRGMQLYEWYYVLHGLLTVYELLDNELALKISEKIGEYIIETWGIAPGKFPLIGRYPGNGHNGGEGSLILEPILKLGRITGNSKYIDWGEKAIHKWDEWIKNCPENSHCGSLTALEKVATGELDVHEIIENLHAHTHHMCLLGLAELAEITGKQKYKNIFLGNIENIIEKYLYITGGLSSEERYVPFSYYHQKNGIEVCPQHTWILMLERAFNWTGKAKYMEEIERTLYNNFLAGQLADGSNWSYMTPLNGEAAAPSSPNCCNAAGSRIAARMPSYIYSLEKNCLYINHFVESEVEFEIKDKRILLSQNTKYPEKEEVNIILETKNPVNFEIKIRVPSFVEDDVKFDLNNQFYGQGEAGFYYSLNREWKNNNQISFKIPLPIKAHYDQNKLAISRGPIVYSYFLRWQDHNYSFHGTPGLYPEDVKLLLDDPEEIEKELSQKEAPEGCLGPALNIPARELKRPPLFLNKKANNNLPAEKKLEVMLLPFVNQGTCRGKYSLFLDYQLK